MFLHVVEAKHVKQHRIVKLSDGSAGETGVRQALQAHGFKPLQDLDDAKTFSLQATLLSCENGADSAPECLKEHMDKPALLFS